MNVRGLDGRLDLVDDEPFHPFRWELFSSVPVLYGAVRSAEEVGELFDVEPRFFTCVTDRVFLRGELLGVGFCIGGDERDDVTRIVF